MIDTTSLREIEAARELQRLMPELSLSQALDVIEQMRLWLEDKR